MRAAPQTTDPAETNTRCNKKNKKRGPDPVVSTRVKKNHMVFPGFRIPYQATKEPLAIPIPPCCNTRAGQDWVKGYVGTMTEPPNNPKIYHITHVKNLGRIARAGHLLSDAQMQAAESGYTVVGMSDIKRRRLEEIDVACHPDTRVGQYVPFYFCPRSIMLYILYMSNHPNLTYRGGQRPIVHLQADLRAAIRWADENGRRWAISDRNAGTCVAEFYNDLHDLNKVDWQAVAATDFRSMSVREGKQAEFLMYDAFPWELIEYVGVIDAPTKAQTEQAICEAGHKPLVNVEGGWYY